MRCQQCSGFAVTVEILPGGKSHFAWFMQTKDPHAHHPSCDKYDELQQLKMLERHLEKQYLLVRAKRKKLEQRRMQALIKRRGLRLV
jgi:hypothetical protein